VTSAKENIHVITSVERRRIWSPQEKEAIVRETSEQGVSVSQIARKYGINPSQLFYWRRLMGSGARMGVIRITNRPVAYP
jgi:transposase